jgi:hypothetical protein
MGKLIDTIKSFFSNPKNVEGLPHVDPFSYPRGSRSRKMAIREAIRNCVRVDDAPGQGKYSRRLMFVCMNCEKIIAYFDSSRFLQDGQKMSADLVVDIMFAAKEEGFCCHLCGSTTYGLAS